MLSSGGITQIFLVDLSFFTKSRKIPFFRYIPTERLLGVKSTVMELLRDMQQIALVVYSKATLST